MGNSKSKKLAEQNKALEIQRLENEIEKIKLRGRHLKQETQLLIEKLDDEIEHNMDLREELEDQAHEVTELQKKVSDEPQVGKDKQADSAFRKEIEDVLDSKDEFRAMEILPRVLLYLFHRTDATSRPDVLESDVVHLQRLLPRLKKMVEAEEAILLDLYEQQEKIINVMEEQMESSTIEIVGMTPRTISIDSDDVVQRYFDTRKITNQVSQYPEDIQVLTGTCIDRTTACMRHFSKPAVQEDVAIVTMKYPQQRIDGALCVACGMNLVKHNIQRCPLCLAMDMSDIPLM